eukprot:TRINITY_DN34572_c0_g1_i1.p1 TRINITY_DN34572_c0_g1~~TRINITY_DN34572_c0_g1_i1.p1  ORF type:complete len:511 (-),score=43.51 TRINITY_DN34572_c0_g1_i1:653-1993(-)
MVPFVSSMKTSEQIGDLQSTEVTYRGEWTDRLLQSMRDGRTPTYGNERRFPLIRAERESTAGEEHSHISEVDSDNYHGHRFNDSSVARLQPDAWHETVAWLRREGADVNPHLVSNAIVRGGALIRSVATKRQLQAGGTLLVVPKKLWIHLDNFPKFRDTPGLEGATTADAQLLRLVAALAVEAKKGDASLFAPYLQRLPTLSDYRAFHPRLAEPQLASDFGALHLVRVMKAAGEVDARLIRLIEAWQRDPRRPHELDSVSKDDLQLAFMRFRSRRIGVEGGQSALVPGVDFINPTVGERVNTRLVQQASGFKVIASKNLNTSQEVFVDYCETCDNSRFLASWGIFLEGNSNPLDAKHRPDCLSVRSPLTGQPVVLREVAEAVLDFVEVGTFSTILPRSNLSGRRVPPSCRRDVLAQPEYQGPLRCSLARLAWEYCGDAWRQTVTAA